MESEHNTRVGLRDTQGGVLFDCLADERDLLTTHLYNVDQIFAAWLYMQCIPAT